MDKKRRVEIDSLRAVSIISVIIFHLDRTVFPYGYLGVDLFFVISGYLITRSILNDYKNMTPRVFQNCDEVTSCFCF